MWDTADYVRFVAQLTDAELDDPLDLLLSRSVRFDAMRDEKISIVQDEIGRRVLRNVGSVI